MQITGTLVRTGESVTIVQMSINGSQVGISYVDASGNLKTAVDNYAVSAIATGCTIVD